MRVRRPEIYGEALQTETRKPCLIIFRFLSINSAAFFAFGNYDGLRLNRSIDLVQQLTEKAAEIADSQIKEMTSLGMDAEGSKISDVTVAKPSPSLPPPKKKFKAALDSKGSDTTTKNGGSSKVGEKDSGAKSDSKSKDAELRRIVRETAASLLESQPQVPVSKLLKKVRKSVSKKCPTLDTDQVKEFVDQATVSLKDSFLVLDWN
ncbi:hypothetical protein AYI68_g3600 [Smittium mucronatum]|uniref:Uncharacterized protein n=1 Tax=Smittium mucronatum TaxID=133383 RepID=A0A1R0GZE8_9FUNG|nr:hypothetical protein AYI68_g3600 [Smittium mucronatum]